MSKRLSRGSAPTANIWEGEATMTSEENEVQKNMEFSLEKYGKKVKSVFV